MKRQAVGKVIIAVTMCVASPLLLAEQPTSMDSALQTQEAGVGRFRAGWYGAAGAAIGASKGTATLGKARLGGLELNAGAYGLFNPIRDFADIEAGMGLSAIIPVSSDNKNGTSYTYGAVSATAYAGPVFRTPNSAGSFGLGAFINVPLSTIKHSSDALLANANLKLKTAPGIYGEYQYAQTGSNKIYYVRGYYARSGVKSSNLGRAFNDAANNSGLIGLQGGVKY